MIEDIRHTKVNWSIFLIFVVIMFVMLFYFDRVWGESRDPKAVALAEKTIQAMGGADAWKQVAAIRFNFQVEPQGKPARAVKHLWDRKNNRAHLEETDPAGKTKVVWLDLGKKEGHAWLDKQEVKGEELKKSLEWAYSRWINDTYWLIMPLKALDRGVNLKQEGEKEGHEILHLSFEKVGETPGDQYWAHINKQTGLMNRWQYTLEDGTKGDWNWVEWQDFGKVKLSKLKTKSDGKANIRFEPLAVLETADPAFFSTELRMLD